MSFASDKLYQGYLLPKMSTIVSKVKVREIVVHLPCLTDHDRENIEAKRELCGNFDSMYLLLDCLKRRENWPEQFIAALEACNHSTIAADMRAQYNTLRGVNNPNPSSPPTTVIRAHVHPAPSASHMSIPDSQASVAPPAAASAPPEPAAQASFPLEIPVQPQAPQSSAAQVAPLEPVAQAKVAPPPSTPPPSPETPRTQATITTPPQREVNFRQEPVEDAELDIQDTAGVNGVIPDQVSTDMTDGSSFPVMTPEKPPVQDSTPPVDKIPAAVLQPEETSEPPATQVVERIPVTETAATTSPLPGAVGIDASLCDDNTLCLSKPGHLISIHPQNHSSPAITAPSSPDEPYSGNTERLEMSEAAVASTHGSACSAVSSTTVNTASALPCQENGIDLIHNEPEENHYDSPCQSLGMQDVRENVVHISEEVSVLDLDGQIPTPQAQIVNGEAAKEMTSAPPLSTSAADSVSSVNAPFSETYHPSEPAPADISSDLKTLQEEKTASCTLPAKTKYILTAVGVGACALLMAWKFKN